MNYILALLGAGLVGVCVALEPTVNSGLGKVITPRLASLHSFLVGTLLLILINFFAGGFSQYKNIVKAPPYFWIGGLIGTVIVYVGARVAPVIWVAATVTIMVAVQLVTSILIDSLGLFGTTKVPLDLGRIAGVLLIVVAVKLIVK